MRDTDGGARKAPPFCLDDISRRMFDVAFEAMFLSENGICVDANRAATELFHISREECVGRHGMDFIAPDQREFVAAQMRKDAAGPYETVAVRKDGTEFPVRTQSRNMDMDGRTIRVTAMTDISETKAALDALGKSEAMLNEAQRLAKVGGWELDVATGEQRWTLETYCIHETKKSVRPTKESGLAFYVPEHRPRIREAVEGCSRYGRPFDEELQIVTGRGRKRWVRSIGRPVYDGENITAIAGAILDVTEKHAVEGAIRESESRFRSIIEGVEEVAIQGYDADRRVIFWNKASEAIYGYTEQEAMGRRLEDLIIPAAMREDVRSAVCSWVDEGVPIPSGELVLRDKYGADVTVHSSHVLINKPDGGCELFCIDVDLSAVKQMQQDLLEAKEQAEAASRTKSEFLANMSHELRTPLNGLMGMLQLLQSTTLDPEQAEYADIAIQSSRRLTRLLSDILDISRIEAGRLQLQHELFSLRSLLRDVRELFALTARRESLAITVRCGEDVPDTLVGDEHRLRQVLTNLVGNAVKFTRMGEVSVGVDLLSRHSPAECRLLFTVADTGVGISPDKMGAIFEAFTQADGAYTRSYQGAGLGLSIVKQLVDLMGGGLALDSEEGRGSTFYLSLPIVCIEEGVGQEGEVEETAPADGMAPIRVLVVEDDMVNRMMLERLLQKAGMAVETAENGERCLTILRKRSFDCILMDIQMPVKDGVETVRELRSSPEFADKADIPVVALTAYAMSGDEEHFLDAGMDAYLAKPVRMEALLAILSRLYLAST